MHISKKSASFSLIILVMIIWGSAFAVTKIAVEQIPPFFFAFLRFLIAVSGLLLYKIAIKKPLKKITAKNFSYVFLCGISGITMYYVFFNLSLQKIPASAGALIQGFIPACIALFAVIFLKEKIQSKQITGIILSVTGVAVLGWGTTKGGEISLFGIILMILSVIAWATYTVISKKVSMLDSFTLTFYTTLIGCMFLIPFALTEIGKINLHVISVTSWIAVLYLGLIGSALCYFLYNKALESLTATQVGNFLNLDPIVGTIIALVFLNEKLDFLQVTGGILVLGGIVLSSFKPKKRIKS